LNNTCRLLLASLGIFSAASLAVAACGGGGGSDSGNNPPATSNGTTAPTGSTASPGRWTTQFGTRFDDAAYGVAADSAGNLFVVGSTEGDIAGTTSAGQVDAFLRSYAPNGTARWTKQFGSPGNDIALDVAVAAGGTIYVVGQTFGTLPGQQSQGVGSDAFLAAFDAEGNSLWTKQFGTPPTDVANGVAVDAQGNVYVVGSSEGSLPGHTNAGGPSVGGLTAWNDIFLVKFDSTGAEVWSKQFGDQRQNEGLDVAVGPNGTVYVAGYTEGQLPGQTRGGGRDAVVRAYDASGAELWTEQLASTGQGTQPNEKIAALAVDSAGNLYAGGSTSGVLPGLSKNEGESDIFVRKYGPDGTPLWTKMDGSDVIDEARGISVDGNGNVVVTGVSEGGIPGGKHQGNIDAFAKAYSSSGGDLWTNQTGSSSDDQGEDVVADAAGNVYMVGRTTGVLPGQPSKQDRDMDAFVLKVEIKR